MPIVQISAIKLNESKNISLVAITQFGLRLYFSINQFESSASSLSVSQQNIMNVDGSLRKSDVQVPSTFQLVHVRIPPSIELTSQSRNGPVSSAYSNNGVTLLMTKRDEQTDSVFLLNRDLFLLHNNMKESKSMFNIDGRIWSVEEIIPSLPSIKSGAVENDSLQTATSASGVELVPKLTAEYFDLPRRFAMITPQVRFFLNKEYLNQRK